jgi:hypothetical protein
MDTATRTLANRIALIVCLARAALAFGSQAPVAAARPMVTSGATAAEERQVDWAFHRYCEGGLTHMPPRGLPSPRSRRLQRRHRPVLLGQDRPVHQVFERAVPAQVRGPRDGPRVGRSER